MKYIMKLNPKYFEFMKNGTKRIEIRLNDEKRKDLKIGDVIVFQKEPELEEELYTQILNLRVKRNFKELIENLEISEYSDKSESEIADLMYQKFDVYIKRQLEQEYGKTPEPWDVNYKIKMIDGTEFFVQTEIYYQIMSVIGINMNDGMSSTE